MSGDDFQKWQWDALDELIWRKNHAAQADRSPQGQDPEEGLDRNDESAVPAGNAPEAPKDSR